MNSSSPTGNRIDTLIDKAAALARGFGFRILIHSVSLYSAVLVSKTVSATPGFPVSGSMAGAGVYLGLICLIPRGVSLAPSWLAPTLTGLLQGLALSLLGMPWQMAVFWAGLQTWLMRLLRARGKIGWEWVVSPFLVIVMISILVEIQPASLAALPLCAMSAGLALGWAVMRSFLKEQSRPGPKPAQPTPEPPKAREKEPEPEPENLKAYRDSAWQLEKKKFQMPGDARPHLEGIRLAVGSIVDCMRADPNDMAPGEQFLQRYLPAAHKVVDEHIRLAKDGGSHQNVADALSGTKDLLARLEKAFVDEHGRLLQNDALNFTVELNVLDKLLKMQGR